ncbi:unnamed protein product [Durusdinium trenchii]|uniref:Uncharacterized protein n=1 Tax=Durusdinium trenchii TaxID=1381693 RepID=A0ABP0J4V0_9DINO
MERSDERDVKEDTKIRSQVSGPSVDEDQDAASTACVSTTSSSFVEELNRSQVKLIFTTSRRGLRCLGRGYSTPDPSPSPLPKCEALREELVFVPDSGGAPEVGANSKEEKPLQDSPVRGRVETEPVRLERSIRTPSPVLERTPRNVLPPPVLPHVGNNVPTPYVSHRGMAVQVVSCGMSMSPTSPMSPTTPHFCTSPWSYQGSYVVGCVGEPSAGSLGHPYNCGPPCKYVKKTRGCKDGRCCTRCHLCPWRGRTSGKDQTEKDKVQRPVPVLPYMPAVWAVSQKGEVAQVFH